jgi:hypothetical protein
MRAVHHSQEGAEPMDGPRHRIVAETERTTLSPLRIIVPLLVGGVFVLFGGVVYYAYVDRSGGDAAPPVVHAEAGPIKEAPKDPGGLDVPNQNTRVVDLFDKSTPPRVERLDQRDASAPATLADVLPAPAEPPAPTVSAQEPAASLPPVAGGRSADVQASPAATPPAAPLPASTLEPGASPTPLPTTPPPLVAPEKATSPADGTETAGNATPIAQEPVPIPRPALPSVAMSAAAEPAPRSPSSQASAPAAPVRTAAVGGPRALTQSAAARAPAVKEASVAPAARATSSGSWRIQLVAVSSRSSAEAAWQVIRQRNPTILSDLHMVIDDSGGALFRLQAGGFADQAGASRVCARLKAAGTDCFVVAGR